MIVDPGFINHWKTKMLVTLTSDPAAPFMILRLWGHCQERKRWVFHDMTDYALKAICGWTGEARDLKPILTECGWLDAHATDVIVHDWAIVNSALIKNWKNGVTGGRPRKTQEEPNGNPAETQEEPTTELLLEENPTETQVKPNGNPAETQEEPKPIPQQSQREPIGLDGIGLDGKQTSGVSVVRSPDQIKDQADLVYLAYPKKVGKPEALKAIVKALKLLPFEELRNRTKDYARAVEGMEPQYIPYPATWFNDQRYADDPSTWNPAAKKAHARNPVTGI